MLGLINIIYIIILIIISAAIILFSLSVENFQLFLKIILTVLSIIFVVLMLFYNYLCFVPLISNNSFLILLALVLFLFILIGSKIFACFKIKREHTSPGMKKIKKQNNYSKNKISKSLYIESKYLIFYFIKNSSIKDHFIKRESKAPFFQIFIKIIKAVTSLDYFISDVIKDWVEENIENSSKANAKLIQYFNWINLSVVLGSAILMIVIFDFEFWNNQIPTAVSKTVLIYFFIRSISRSLEIIYAFFGDVATRKGNVKSTDLDRYDRLSLAVTSYIEMIISYSIFYYLWAVVFINNHKFILLDKLIKSVGIMTFSDVHLFNRSTEDIRIFLFNTAVALQIITSIVLVVFAVASYLSDNQ